jgi:pilus assembly protein Flp/PilA
MPKLNMIVAYLREHLSAGDEGATAVEYGLLVSLIAVVIIVGVTAFGSHLNDVFDSFKTKF